jgi:LacI family transcriptional regulator
MSTETTKTRERVTQRDIADAVGVSHVTVSHVLHNSQRARVNEETRREILQMARAMSYEPRSITTHNICIVLPPESLWADVTTNVLAAADAILRDNGYRMTVSTLDESTIATAPKLFNQKTVDGMIFTEWHGDKSRVLHSLKIPWLLLADVPDLDSRVDQIAFDTVNTTRKVAEYLYQKGHKHICVVTGTAGIGMHDRIIRGAYNAAASQGLPDSNVKVIHDEDGSELESLLLEQLKSSPAPTAILTGGPGSAVVTLNRLQRNGYRVPEDVSLISLVDSQRLPALRPCISSTTAIGKETVEMAVKRLLERIKNPAIEPERRFIQGEIIERDSVVSPAP